MPASTKQRPVPPTMQINTTSHGAATVTNMEAQVEARADVLFSLMSDPSRHPTLFKHIEKVDFTLLEEEGPRRKYSLDYNARWHFWKFSGTFVSKFFFHTDADKGTVTYKLREPGFLQEYDGTWQFLPEDRESLALGSCTRRVQPPPRLTAELVAGIAADSDITPARSVVRVVNLRQAPKNAPPPGLRGMLRSQADRGVRDNLQALLSMAVQLPS